MTDYRIELQAFVDAAASFTEPTLGHHKAWAEAVARARVALSMPESSASTVCPITPPPELVQQWRNQAPTARDAGATRELWIAAQAARWGADHQLKLDTEQINQAWQKGADQELEACCEWLDNEIGAIDPEDLRAERRPKLLSLKELALASVKRFEESGEFFSDQMRELEFIREALEQLDD
jgi:hypothetical protein